MGGDPQRTVFTGSHDNLAVVEATFEKIASDAHYQALVAKGLDNFVEGTMEDRILKVL